MRTAVIVDQHLQSPTVGTWHPAVSVGAPLVPGMRLGWLERLGRRAEVRAPEDCGGVAITVAPSGSWVAFGDGLVEFGAEVGGVAVARAPVSTGGPEGAVPVRAETDGTVWLSPKPGTPPYVQVGGGVAAQATLLLVEVMKTFSPVRAPVAGHVVRIDVATGAGVEAGAALVWIRPT